MTTGIVIPVDLATTRGDSDRSRACDYVTDRLVAEAPHDWVVAHGIFNSAFPWCKAEAVQAGLDVLDDVDVLILHDADVIVGIDAIRAAETAVRDGAPWAIPHRTVLRLDILSTAAFMANEEHLMTLVRPTYVGVEGGGVTVVRRDVWDACPLDRRFVGWGSEDEAWGMALHTLYGPPHRGDAPLMHLWHAHPAPGARRSPMIDSVRLHRAYRAYRDDPEAMRALVASARSSPAV